MMASGLAAASALRSALPSGLSALRSRMVCSLHRVPGAMVGLCQRRGFPWLVLAPHADPCSLADAQARERRLVGPSRPRDSGGGMRDSRLRGGGSLLGVTPACDRADGTPFAALRAAVPTGGRRSPSRPRDSTRSRDFAVARGAGRRPRRSKPSPRFCAAIRDLAAPRPRCRPEVGAPQAVPAIHAQARERRPLVGTARRRRAAGRTPTSEGAFASSRPRDSMQTGYTPLAALRAAVPTGGRRSPSRPRDADRRCAVRCAARSGADRRSAFPKPSPRFNGGDGYPRGLAALRAAVPTGGRRSPGGRRPRDSTGRRYAGRSRSRPSGRRVPTGGSAFPKPTPRFRGRRRYAGSRAAARCRPEVGVPQAVPAIRAVGDTRSRCAARGAVPTGGRRSWGGVVGAGFALPRDAGRRPALHAGRDLGGYLPSA